MTSNPTIFDKAISGSTDYDAALHRALEDHSGVTNPVLAERLIVEDISVGSRSRVAQGARAPAAPASLPQSTIDPSPRPTINR